MTDAALHIWLNVATVLVLAGAATYVSLIPYMTHDGSAARPEDGRKSPARKESQP